ncbi:MAG: acyl-CoA dehydrogenase family protein, partial [Candidatus Nanohaloarchaea archaeon]|nr:acyl-CoA dehydrogenase family protein [Candidatus Nanohaloarchaea archaeon]
MVDEKVLNDVKEFCEELRPTEDVHYLEHEYNEETIPLAKEHDLMGLPVPREYGGRGVDEMTYIKALERIGMEGSGIRTIFSVHTSLFQKILMHFGSDRQKQEYLKPSASGDILGAYALTEPEAGSDPMAMETTYTEEDGHYILNGSKYLISNAGIADAIIVFAKDQEGIISAFVIDADQQGIEVEDLVSKMGTPTTNTGMFDMKDLKVPKENMIGGKKDGWRIAMDGLIDGRLGVAAGCVGSMKDCLVEASEYAKEREQHGKPIAKHQLVQEHIAEIKTKYEAARQLLYRAVEKKQEWEEDRSNQELRDAADQAVSEAKFYAARVSYEAADRGVQIYGGRGWSFLYRPGRHLVDNRVTRIYEGSE